MRSCASMSMLLLTATRRGLHIGNTEHACGSAAAPPTIRRARETEREQARESVIA